MVLTLIEMKSSLKLATVTTRPSTLGIVQPLRARLAVLYLTKHKAAHMQHCQLKDNTTFTQESTFCDTRS
jgi:hypothetical protein